MSVFETQDLLHSIYDEDIGFRLTNFSIKPVHVANGLARALTGRSYENSPLSKFLRRYVRQQKLGIDVEANKHEKILLKYKDAFAPRDGSEVDREKLTRLRALGLDVLGADRAVFPTADHSSFTLSNELLITNDPSDVRSGLFLARLLEADLDQPQDARELLKQLLQNEDDAWTTLALPLLRLNQCREVRLSDEVKSLVSKSDSLFQIKDSRFQSSTLNTLRSGFDRLARFEDSTGSKLNSLRRLMLYGTFVLYLHTISRWSEVDPSAPRPPMLLDLLDGSVKTVRNASRSTVRAAGDSIEGLIRSRFKKAVIAEIGEDPSELQNAIPSDDSMRAVRASFNNLIGSGASSTDALVGALVEHAIAQSKKKEHPIGSLIELGRRSGFLTPWSSGGGGKLYKRYTATSEFLEILVAATVEPEEPLEFPEFLDLLRDRFGILVGRPEEHRLIQENNLRGGQFGTMTSISEDDLRANVHEMRRLVVECGYGKTYADGQTIVTSKSEAMS